MILIASCDKRILLRKKADILDISPFLSKTASYKQIVCGMTKLLMNFPSN